MSDDRDESMWYCPDCEMWVGWKLDECSEGHKRPWRPLRSVDVDKDHAWNVTLWDRIRAKFRL